MDNKRLVVCVRDGWVSFPVTKEFAKEQIDRFNEWYAKQPPSTQECYGGEATLKSYACLRCGGSEFRPYQEGIDVDCRGSTVGPVIYEENQ